MYPDVPDALNTMVPTSGLLLAGFVLLPTVNLPPLVALAGAGPKPKRIDLPLVESRETGVAVPDDEVDIRWADDVEAVDESQSPSPSPLTVVPFASQ
jgi:hypothetical protein